MEMWFAFMDSGQIVKYLGGIHTAQIGRSILVQQILNVPVQLSLICLAAEFPQSKHCIPAGVNVAPGDSDDHLANQIALPFRQTAHHAHIQPDDLAVPHAKVSWMRIRMEEAVLHDLANVVVRQLCADLGNVIARCAKRLMIVDGDSIDALH